MVHKWFRFFAGLRETVPSDWGNRLGNGSCLYSSERGLCRTTGRIHGWYISSSRLEMDAFSLVHTSECLKSVPEVQANWPWWDGQLKEVLLPLAGVRTPVVFKKLKLPPFPFRKENKSARSDPTVRPPLKDSEKS